MNERPNITLTKRLTLLMLFAALAVASTASAARSAGLPPGHLCGSVSGAAWKYEGQNGTRYNVSGLPAGSCGAALKAVAKLTKQKAQAGALGARTLTGPRGFRCVGTGVLSPATAGFCVAGNGAKFFWAPRLKK